MRSDILHWMDRPSARTAIIDACTGREWTYGELASVIREKAAGLASEHKSLVACVCRPDVDSATAYLASLHAGHAVMLTGPDMDVLSAAIRGYRPDFLLKDGRCERLGASMPGEIHPGLAVLLCTSGSTGSPKFVRLSHANIAENASQIVQSLAIGSAERALQSLPIHYSYGLSVLNSHLLAEASIVFSPASILQPGFWDAVSDHGCTSFAAVPHMYAMLARVGFERLCVPSLTTLTQAGGRLEPEAVLAVARFMRARGGRLFVMYGQTEATARMAYVPPRHLLRKPGSVGIAVPGGRMSLAPDGELIFEGPNVMLGYALDRADLALGDLNQGLPATGDLAKVDDEGFYSIVGRKRRIAKLCGLRINLDEVEGLVAAGVPVAALEVGDRLLILREGGAALPARDLARKLGRMLGLPAARICVRDERELPRTNSGKTDYGAIARSG